MEKQSLEDQLDAIECIARAAFDEAPEGTPTKTLALRILMTYLMPTEASPSGGMVDTKHSKCFDASRPGSSPGKGTTTSADCLKCEGTGLAEMPLSGNRYPCPCKSNGKVTELELKPVQEGVPPKEIAVIVCGVETGWSTTSTPCGGCGAATERERCIGCFHEFYEE